LLVSSGTNVEAVTYKVQYGVTLGCNGPDGVAGTGDDTCTCVGGGAYALDQCPDLMTSFNIPATAWNPVDPDHANFFRINTFHAPPEWGVSRDFDIPNGAYAGLLYANSTLSIANSPCPSTFNVTVPVPLYHCSTDNKPANQIAWIGDGSNLTQDNDADTLPDGCNKYPAHVDTVIGGLKPRDRLYGWANAVAGAPPTQINFVIFSPEQLTQVAGQPNQSFGDSLGYSNQVIMDNPVQPVTVSQITEFCTPLGTQTFLWGRSGGKGVVVPKVGANGELGVACINWQGTNRIGIDDDADTTKDDGCWVVQDWCGDGTGTDPLCGLKMQRNPNTRVGGLTSGILGTATHLIGVYSESQRDKDGDGFPNNMDACPYTAGTLADAQNGCDGCTNTIHTDVPDDADCPAAQCNPLDGDCDNDTYMNRQDLCPFIADDQTDADQDGIGKACDTDNGTKTPPNGDLVPDGTFLTDMIRGGICVGSTDTDGDGWCDATETLLGSTGGGGGGGSTPEAAVLDYYVASADSPPGQAPGTCSDYDYYGTDLVQGAAVDNDGDTLPNTDDERCSGENDECVNFMDDDADTFVNDGCDQKGAAPEAACADRVDSDADTIMNDGCPPVGAAESNECQNAIDDDGDTNVNDGCPRKGTAENPACVNALDDDPADDTPGLVVNDGCPPKGAPEVACADALDNDGDTMVNDGCPVDGAVGENVQDQCAEASGAAIDNDGDTNINDGCPAKHVYKMELITPPPPPWPPDPPVSSHWHELAPVESQQWHLTSWVDNGDGVLSVCDYIDMTQELPPTGKVEWFHVEYIDPAVPVMLLVPRPLSLFDVDADGAGDTADNCPNVPNPEQLNLDGDANGDACDSEDDADGMSDVQEWNWGYDAKDACSPFDLDASQTVDVFDILLYKPVLAGAYDAKFDLNQSGGVDVFDILLYKPVLAGPIPCPYRYGSAAG
jgi:hypothetical protein